MNLRQLIAPVLAAVIAAGAAQAAFYQWSTTSATNATADPSINWSEGMSPGSVNDSARAMMSALARYRDDIAGLGTAGGTSSAYTLTSLSSVTNPPPNGFVIAFFPTVTNVANVTLAVDGGTAYRIATIATAPGTDLVPAGTLIAGSFYTVRFCTVCGGVGQWILANVYGAPASIPIGGIIDFSGTVVPNSNFALANGQCISRTTYAAYFALVSTTFGACDGSTTFAVPDLSNRVVAGTQMGGTARITVAGGNFDGNTLGTAGGAQNHTLTTAQLPVITPAGTNSALTFTGTGATITATGNVNISDTRTWGVTGANVYVENGAGPGGVGAGANAASSNPAVTVVGGSISGSFTGTGVSYTPAGTINTPSFTGTPFGSGASHPNVQPTMVLTKIVRIF